MRPASLALLLVPVLTFAACGGRGEEAGASAPAQAQPAARAPDPTPLPATDPAAPRFVFPVACRLGQDCRIQRYMDRDPGPGVLDYRCGAATNDGHEGLDIRLPDMTAQARGVAVLAAAPGKVLRVRDGVADVSARVVGAEAVTNIGCGNAVVIDHGNGWTSSYCHMAQGSVQVKPGDEVAAGQPLGRIGLSGLTEYPHLHFSVLRGGVLTDPFAPGPVAPGACPAQASLWSAEAARALAYRPGAILNAGFAGEPMNMDRVESGQFTPAGPDAPALVAYMRAISLLAGDSLQLSLTGPGGEVLAETTTEPMAQTRAHQLQFIGKRRPPGGWPPGVYRAELRILRDGKVWAEKRIETRF